jgi:subtilisin family serine protease
MRKNFILLLLFVPFMLFAQIDAIDGVNLQKAIPDGRVDSVYQGISLPQAFTGEDVIIGVTDWGFDYTHPVFYDIQKENYRILRAWDQYRNAGPAPEGFTYGTELVGQEALLAAQCDTFNVYEYGYHGTHVTSIAAGSGKNGGTSFRGVAPGANIILCTFLVSEQAVIDAFHWMYQVAQQEQKRLVINMSWGLHFMGYMDGTGPIADAMQELSDLGVVFVSSAGNNGDVKFHVHQDFNTNTDTLKSKIGFAEGGESYRWGQSITMTSSPNTSFRYAIAVMDGSGTVFGYTPFYDTRRGNFSLDTTAEVLGIPVE